MKRPRRKTGLAESSGAYRVTRHRAKRTAESMRRLEVSVPVEDASLVRALAAALRAGGEPAKDARRRLAPLVRGRAVATGADLVAFLRASPLAQVDLVFERDRSTGRPIEL